MTLYIIIGLNVILIILVIILLFKKNKVNNTEVVEKLGKFEADINKSIGDFIGSLRK